MPTIFDHICRALSLGSLIDEPVQLSGGYTHRMFALDTTQGRFAVKLLNPEIMQRPDALDNYRRAEGFEALLEAQGLPILPALTIGGRKLQCVDGQHLYAFDYYEGRVLSDAGITPAHCAAMSGVLAHIHASARRALPDPPEAPAPIDWPMLTEALLACPETLAEGAAMQAALPMLARVTRAAEDAALRLPHQEALCHNDMDAKNVLWQGSDFRIIDLECLGFADPAQELLDLAVSWAGHTPDEARLKSFLRAYRAAGGDLPADPAAVYDSRRNYLDWLAYNTRRALSADPQEARTGREQITQTLDKITDDQRHRTQILRWIGEVSTDE